MGDRSTDGETASTEPTNVEGDRPIIEETTATEAATVHEEGTELERTIGLVGGLSIGVGTMIGAGIFVFPGLAAGEAGPAAMGSFAIGAVIALLVALPASELATAMPRSGGGYYFISRGLGTVYGTIVGLGLWLGLVFASAFYLVGFGHYAAAVLLEVGISVPFNPAAPLGVLFGVGLAVLSVTGTERTAAIQNVVVALLLGILTLFLVYGGLDSVGVFGTESTPERFAPFGWLPVLQTAALVFTSYLGFAQVATVAGEIKQPSRNLPLAMVGSVVLVGAFYVATIFVATSAFPSAELGTFGETAIVEVARAYAGPLGAVAILLAGLLATISSANASILSSSRAVYALSKDALLPREASAVNLRWGTPHVALGLAGVPIVVLTATDAVVLLAEVASFLHLVMYGLICVALIALRRNPPDWYDPDFRTPAYPALPAAGALASFGLIAFMDLASIVVGVGVIAVTFAWYLYYTDDVELKGKL
ncbi:APC family permease [Natronobiforma cellulositropha]|uniref:APC family permease n=1 Tax=Natronobiforma cellulositropha TaxID=1679076 RepID=UPI0021D5CC48|nr:APC family permease [Natronobiforma cellulositropha]